MAQAMRTRRCWPASQPCRDVGGSNDAVFGLRDAIAKGLVPGPRMRAAGQAVSVDRRAWRYQTATHRMSWRCLPARISATARDDCRRAVRQQVKEGADVIKITATGGVLSNTKAGLEQQFTAAELEAIVETAHSMGRKVTAHAHGKVGIESALRAGIDSIEHGTYTDDENHRPVQGTQRHAGADRFGRGNCGQVG
jgi:imidazolonepropionase-like amidohydrolase